MHQSSLCRRSALYPRRFLSGQSHKNSRFYCRPTPGSVIKTTLDFSSPQDANAGKTNYEVARGWFVFKLFTFDFLVDNSLKCFNISKKLLGLKITEKLLKATVFGQFVGGLDEKESEVPIRQLSEKGISSIWNYSVEQDLNDADDVKTEAGLQMEEEQLVQVYEKYLTSIKMSASCNCDRPARFAAIKCTAIINPYLARKLTKMIILSESVFISLATKADIITDRVIPSNILCKEIQCLNNHKLLGVSTVDIIQWNQYFSIADNVEGFSSLSKIAKVNHDKLKLTEVEKRQLNNFLDKLEGIGKCASEYGVRVLVDAEQTYFQKFFDHVVVHHIMPLYNKRHAVIYNTVQAYLKHSMENILVSLATAEYFQVTCGIKLVRGAYLYQEQQLAIQSGQQSPTFASKEDTDENYNSCVTYLLNQVASKNVEIVVASHNRHSVELAAHKIQELEISRSNGRVCFGQLLGMGDFLTYPLASAGFIANKVIVYGSLDDVVPFLVRRGQENRGLLENSEMERQLYFQELKRRLFG